MNELKNTEKVNTTEVEDLDYIEPLPIEDWQDD